MPLRLSLPPAPPPFPSPRPHSSQISACRRTRSTSARCELTASRWLDNQNRTLAYLRFVDVDRLLYNFRANHKLSTNGAAATGGWDAPSFPFRTHMQGHFLTAWAQAYAVTGDTTCRDKATTMVAELARCQANNAAAGFTAGYLSGFPESDFTKLESGSLTSGNVPYYCVHKTLAGLLDVWRIIGSTQARDVLLALAGWVDTRTSRLSTSQMQSRAEHRVRRHERGAGRPLPADRRLAVADRRPAVRPRRVCSTRSRPTLTSSTVCTPTRRCPSGSARPGSTRPPGPPVTGTSPSTRGTSCVNAHSYVIGGNSQAEHFRAPNAIAGYLNNDTCEHCNTYNMLKLTRELWLLNPHQRRRTSTSTSGRCSTTSIGAQNPADSHGHVTYFTPLNPGGRRGVGPAWGGGTWSTDYNSFWCCQGTGIETNTKLMDSIYFYNGTTLTVNLFLPSVLTWSQRGITVTQTTAYPVSDTTTLTVTGGCQRVVVDAYPHPQLDHRGHDQCQRRRAERHRHPGHVRDPDPLLGLRRHRHRPAADAGGRAGRQRQRQRRPRSPTVRWSCPATTATPHCRPCRP